MNVQILSDNNFSQNVNPLKGLFTIGNNSTSNSYYLQENNVLINYSYYTWLSPRYNAPIIINAALMALDGDQYFCINSSQNPIIEWAITPEMVDGNDNYQSTVYSFSFSNNGNCYNNL